MPWLFLVKLWGDAQRESGGEGWDRDGPQGTQPSCPSTTPAIPS